VAIVLLLSPALVQAGYCSFIGFTATVVVTQTSTLSYCYQTLTFNEGAGSTRLQFLLHQMMGNRPHNKRYLAANIGEHPSGFNEQLQIQVLKICSMFLYHNGFDLITFLL